MASLQRAVTGLQPWRPLEGTEAWFPHVRAFGFGVGRGVGCGVGLGAGG